ncbi:hypothetical protein OIE62_18460 [Streptomyces scopuliridis]|uniref:Uncharacterized protein n=1 Tax=Streptomyces scopuliridis TaxID=452529 RepID=A0ACD4ZLY3_9ACTN|nr:hypothetical protein [Streptomyces scopuliridis]WSB99504.1 hypothetical protein OG835_22495 [Streptomyces scopuliridis]WSC06796.1 hypothetical protein OIE62_18460 [Streptomyces scopuliridis]
MTHSGQGDEPQHPAARPAHEGVVLPSDGSGPWIPGTAADQDRAVPTGGQPWGQPWGPQDGRQDQPGYGGGAPSAPPSYGQTYGQSYEPQQGGQSYGAPLPPAQGQPVHGQPAEGQPYAPYQQYPQGQQLPQAQPPSQPQPLPPVQAQSLSQPLPLPAEAPAPGSADATQYLPPVPAMGASDATQFIAPIPPGPGMLPPESAAEATQYLPSTAPPPQGPDADATQYIAPVPAQNVPAAPPGAPYGIRPGAPGDRQPPAEFDNLFRTDGPGGGQGAESTQQMPQFDAGRGPQPPQQPQQQRGAYGQQPAAYQQPPAQQGPTGGGRGSARRKSSRAPVIAAVVVGCAVLGLGAGALMSGGGDSPQDDSKTVASESSPSTEPSIQAAPDPVKQQAEALDKLLADSNSSRSTVISAVEDIKSCDNLDQAATDLHGAAEQRRGLVTQLEALTLDKLPNHTELTSSLTDAWQASASADDHYAQWAKQTKGKKGCKDGHARTTSQAAKGNQASGEATAAKHKASGLWNSIATKYGLTERAPTQL